METETSARWALFIFTLSSNRAKENISTRDGKRSGGKGIRPLEMTNGTGRLVKSWAVHSAAFTFTRQSPESKTNIPVRLSVSRLFSLNVPFCCGCLPLPVIQRSSHAGPAVPPSADIPFFSTALSSHVASPCFCWPGGAHKNASDASLSWRGQSSAQQLWDDMKHSSRRRSGLRNGLYVT